MPLQIGSSSGQDERQMDELLSCHLVVVGVVVVGLLLEELLSRHLDLPWVHQLLTDALLQKAFPLLTTPHSCRRKDEDCKHGQWKMHPSPV